MKIKNSYLKLLFWILVGAIIGAVGGLIGSIFEIYRFRDILSNTFESAVENIIWFQLAVALILGVGIFINYMSARKLVVMDRDEDIGEISERLELKQTYALALCSINYILSFILFGTSVDGRNPSILGSVIIFLVSIIASSCMEVALVNQVKKSNPMKKGDPAELNFENKWIDSCDEAEQFIIYQAAYKTFIIMKYLLLALLVVGLVFKIVFDTGNLPIILVGFLWLIMSISHSYYGFKLQKHKINV